MGPTKTLWPLSPHTRGKHLVLQRYLGAWLPIMGSRNGRILFIDGFAGPGEYKGGEDGSPIIALKSLIEHRAKHIIRAEIVFIFIEQDNRRADHLESLVNQLSPCLPSQCKTEILRGAFNDNLTTVLDKLDAQARQLAPCFVMVDPFGVSDTPMSVLHRILGNPRSEVYISFMYESINRFMGTPEFERHLDELFGSPNWRHATAIDDSNERKEFLYALYEEQLRRGGATHVIHFELYQDNRLVYTIFFGTQNLKGCDRMKEAIWKTVPFGDFAFRACRSGQLQLQLANPDFEPLKSVLLSQFHQTGWVRIEDILDFVASDKTDYHSGQVKNGVLAPMERSGEIEVRIGTRKRRNYYPNGTVLRFL